MHKHLIRAALCRSGDLGYTTMFRTPRVNLDTFIYLDEESTISKLLQRWCNISENHLAQLF